MQSNSFFLKVYLEAFMSVNHTVAAMVCASPSQKWGVGLRKKPITFLLTALYIHSQIKQVLGHSGECSASSGCPKT